MPCKCVPSVFVTIYSTPTSVEGEEARNFFNRKGVPFEELDIAADPQALQRLRELSGQTDRPVIVVNDHVFVGFDDSQMESAVPSLY
jgi:glutaredoxin